jgi:hypothetical protein
MNWFRKILGMSLIASFLVVFTACSDDEPSPYKDDYEPNNSITSPTDIVLGTTYNVSISKGDRDFYRFTLDNGTVLENAKIELGNFADNLQLECAFYDGLGTKLVTYWNDPGFGYVVFWPAVEGTFYLEIGDKDNSAKGDYSLKVSDLDDSDANEPNNTFGNATVIDTYPSGVINANLVASANATYPNGDWDYYLVVVNPNKKVDFTISPQATDLVMQFNVYDESQSEVDPGITGGAGAVLDYYLNNATGAAVTLYVRVGGTLGASYERDYTISFTESDAN